MAAETIIAALAAPVVAQEHAVGADLAPVADQLEVVLGQSLQEPLDLLLVGVQVHEHLLHAAEIVQPLEDGQHVHAHAVAALAVQPDGRRRGIEPARARGSGKRCSR